MDSPARSRRVEVPWDHTEPSCLHWSYGTTISVCRTTISIVPNRGPEPCLAVDCEGDQTLSKPHVPKVTRIPNHIVRKSMHANVLKVPCDDHLGPA